jgi:hypothetical protein
LGDYGGGSVGHDHSFAQRILNKHRHETEIPWTHPLTPAGGDAGWHIAAHQRSRPLFIEGRDTAIALGMQPRAFFFAASAEAITSSSPRVPHLRSHGWRVLTRVLGSIGAAIAASVAIQSTRSSSFTPWVTPVKGVCTVIPSTHNKLRKHRGAFACCILPTCFPVPTSSTPSIYTCISRCLSLRACFSVMQDRES